LQASLREHFEKLIPGAHVDGLRDHLADAVVDENVGNAA
jgi:hypothetical protein